MMTPNRLAAFVLIAFCLCYGYFASQQPRAQAVGDPGLTLFPWLLTFFLLFLSITLFVQDIRGKALPRRFDFKITAGGVRAVIGLLLIFAYLCAMPYLGFLISSILFFGSIMWLGGDRRPFRLLGFPCGITLFLYFFFGELFQIPLPKGDLLGGLF
jgi:putative tricarboxylic transport membrane protein